jgi:hypothetical protein
MTDQELKDLVAGLAVESAKLAVQSAKTDEKIGLLALAQAKTEKEVQETSRVVKEIGERMGSMGNNQGAVAEEFFYNSLKAKPELGGVSFDTVTPNLIIGTKKASSEFDIVLVNGRNVALVEVKYKAHKNDLDQLEKQIARYRKLRPEPKGYKIFGGIAGFKVPADVIKLAHERGMFVLQRKGDVIETDAGTMRAF